MPQDADDFEEEVDTDSDDLGEELAEADVSCKPFTK